MDTLTATNKQVIDGTESRDIVVPAGVRLYIAGIADGDLYIEAGGKVDVTGGLRGAIRLNDGVLRLAEGAFVGDKMMAPDGLTASADSPRPVITRDTPRHRLVGTHGNYGVHL
jgi:hypothetical protein